MKIFAKSDCRCFLIFSLCFASITTSDSLNADAEEWSNRKCFENEPPKTRRVNEGDFFELSCQPLNDCPHSGVYWIKQYYDGTIKSINDSRITIDSEGTVRFRNVSKRDASNEYYYACAVDLPSFHEYKIGNRVILEVVASKERDNRQCSKDEPPTTLRVNEGDPFKLSCQPLDDCPHSGVYWIKLFSNGSIKSINDSRITLDPEGTLWFSNVTQSDASDDFYYACAVVLPSLQDYRIGNRVTLEIVSNNATTSSNEREPVKQYVSRRKEVAILGKNIELFCIYGGTPLPMTVWSKNFERIRPNDRLIERNYGKSLLIKNVNLDDEGVYMCDMSNGVGIARSSSFHLEVQS